jgi:hypothetical protein
MINHFVKKIAGFFLVLTLIASCVTLAFALDPKGRPKGMGPNAASGYYIWQDDKGWHLRAISGSQQRKFDGEITCDGGSINDVKQYRDESANWFKVDGNKIKINLNTDKNIDGFDFQVNGGSLTFDLRVDDRAESSTIRVGANSENPSGVPFTVQVK